jgi:hypothetical protein
VGEPKDHQRHERQDHDDRDKKRTASCLADEPFAPEPHKSIVGG